MVAALGPCDFTNLPNQSPALRLLCCNVFNSIVSSLKLWICFRVSPPISIYTSKSFSHCVTGDQGGDNYESALIKAGSNNFNMS